jgi:hypothetical protein
MSDLREQLADVCWTRDGMCEGELAYRERMLDRLVPIIQSRLEEELVAVKAELTALKADAQTLASLANAYAGNLELLKQMQELARRVLVATRRP